MNIFRRQVPPLNEPVQNAALGEKLKQQGQHDFLLRDHDVAQPDSLE